MRLPIKGSTLGVLRDYSATYIPTRLNPRFVQFREFHIPLTLAPWVFMAYVDYYRMQYNYSPPHTPCHLQWPFLLCMCGSLWFVVTVGHNGYTEHCTNHKFPTFCSGLPNIEFGSLWFVHTIGHCIIQPTTQTIYFLPSAVAYLTICTIACGIFVDHTIHSSTSSQEGGGEHTLNKISESLGMRL